MLMKIFDEHDHLGTSRLPARSLAVGLFVVAAGFLTVVLLNVGTLAVFGNNVIYSQDQGYSFLGFRILNPECLF